MTLSSAKLYSKDNCALRLFVILSVFLIHFGTFLEYVLMHYLPFHRAENGLHKLSDQVRCVRIADFVPFVF